MHIIFLLHCRHTLDRAHIHKHIRIIDGRQCCAHAGQWGERFNPWLVACSTASRCCPRRGKSCQADRKLQQGPGTALTPHRPQCASQLCLCSQGEPVHMCTHTYPLHKCVIPTASCLMVYKQTPAGKNSLPHHEPTHASICDTERLSRSPLRRWPLN